MSVDVSLRSKKRISVESGVLPQGLKSCLGINSSAAKYLMPDKSFYSDVTPDTLSDLVAVIVTK